MRKPKKEVWYCWKEFIKPESCVEGILTIFRLITPWANPDEYEFPADFLFKTRKKALEWKKENAENEDWYLVRKTLEPIEFVEGVTE